MKTNLLEILACPGCGAELNLHTPSRNDLGEVISGELICSGCGDSFRIVHGIPRFVESHPANSSFGFQWNSFRKEQLDSANGAGLSASRLWSETGWEPNAMQGRKVLDVGCGAGRFLEVAAASGCSVIGVDVSNAIDAAAATVACLENVDLVQADVYRLPFRPGSFDDCYFIGVAQHTPDPSAAIRAIPRVLKPGGRMAVSMYERRPWTLLNGKYLLRPLTKRLNKQVLLGAIKVTMPLLFPLTEVLFRIPKMGRAFTFLIPVANYVHLTTLTWRQRYDLAVLDTFDRLAPQFDHPLTGSEVSSAMSTSGMENLRRLPNSGVNMIGVRGNVDAG